MSPLFPYLYKDTGGGKKRERKEKRKMSKRRANNKLPYKVSKRVTAEASSEL